MSRFAVGDVVEIVKTIRPGNEPWLGRQVVVTSVGVPGIGRETPNGADGPYLGVVTIPRPREESIWRDWQLRKINPPDWQAPRVRETELTE